VKICSKTYCKDRVKEWIVLIVNLFHHTHAGPGCTRAFCERYGVIMSSGMVEMNHSIVSQSMSQNQTLSLFGDDLVQLIDRDEHREEKTSGLVEIGYFIREPPILLCSCVIYEISVRDLGNGAAHFRYSLMTRSA